MIYNSSYFKFAINFIDKCRTICRKTKMCPFNVTTLIIHWIIWNFCKKASGSWFLSCWWSIIFANNVLEKFRICPLNITKSQKTKNDKIFIMILNFFYFKCAINLIDNCRVICRKTKMCPFNITFIHKLLHRITI